MRIGSLTSPRLAGPALVGAALLLVFGAAGADAQTLLDVGAAQGIRSDLESRNLGNRNRNNDQRNDADADNNQADAAEADADGADAVGEAAPAPAPREAWDKWDDAHSVKRQSTGFVSWIKAVAIVFALAVWVRTGDWINRDAQIFKLSFFGWNIGMVAGGLLAAALVLVLPFAAAYPLMLVAGFGPMIGYAVYHNRSVEQHQRVFTPDWFRFQLGELAGKVGIKVKTDRVADYEKGAAVDLIARGGGDETKDKANLLTARQSPGYVLVKEMIAEMVRRRSEQVLLDYRQQEVSVRHYVDGVWHNGESTERDSGDVMLAVMKQLANLKPTERRAKQAGEIGAKYDGVDYDIGVTSQGVKTGERVVMKLTDPKKKSLSSYTDLGMREKISSQWSEVLAADAGLAVISTQPGEGLTTLANVSLLETDRLMRDFFSVEDVNKPEREIENVVVHTYDAKQNESPATILEKLVRLYPNAYVCRDFVDEESAAGLIEQANDGKLVLTTARANGAPEALLRLLKNKAPRKELAEAVTGSINMRLIRLLCDECKVGFEPSAEMLKKLGIPAGKAEMLYRTPKEEEIKKPCKACNGVGYRGRTGLFELLIVNDKVREVLVKQPKVDLLRKASRSAGMRNHQEEGILLVAKGATSIQELQRVLKG